MAIFEKQHLKNFSDKSGVDLSKSSLNKNLSSVGYDNDGKFFYMTADKAVFSDPVSTIKTVLDAHGYVPNLENILSCLDSFVFSIRAKVPEKDESSSPVKINEYLPCLRFELPQKNKVGDILQSFYDEVSKYESGAIIDKNALWATSTETGSVKNLKAEILELKTKNKELSEQLSAVTLQLHKEQKSLNLASKALDSQRVLPDNAKIGRVEKVDLKKRMVKVKCYRDVIDIPTHILNKVPDFQAQCLITFREGEDIPLGIVFFNNDELGSVERRTADLLYVEGDTFKARDSQRNVFQIKAVNILEANTIKNLSRGMKVIISIADGYVVRFSVLGATDPEQYTSRIQEQFIVYDLARNQLVTLPTQEEF